MKSSGLCFKKLALVFLLLLLALVLIPKRALFAEVLEVEIDPQGAGRVEDNRGEIRCPQDCSYNGSPLLLTLTAIPNPGYKFLYWTGGNLPYCRPPCYSATVQAPATIPSNLVTAHFELIVNRPPVLDPIGDKTVNEGEELSFSITASDPDGDPLFYSTEGFPEGASFVSPTFSWTPGFDQAGTYEVTFWVSDMKGGRDSETITITVENVSQPPVLDPIGDKSVNEGELLSFTVTASDPDNDPLTFSVSGLPSGASFNAGTQIFQWTPTSGQQGTYPVTFEVSDGELTDTETINITVIRTGRPGLPSDPYQVDPDQGGVGVDPEGLCFSWPGADGADEYDFLLSRNRSFSSADLEATDLTNPSYCPGAPAASKNKSRTSSGLDYGQVYFWKVIARNAYGETTYPLYGFSTLMPEGTEIEAPEAQPDLEYRMISIPLYPQDPNPIAVLGDDLGPYSPTAWRLFRYNSSDGQNHEFPDVPDMAPGLAYWLIARKGEKLDAQGNPAGTGSDFVVRIPPGFFQLGCPFYFPVKWSEVKVRKGGVTAFVGDAANHWISPILWRYEGGSYGIAEVLEPWKGYWVENVSNEVVELLIPPQMFVE